MKRFKLFLSYCLILATVISACGKDDDDSQVDSPIENPSSALANVDVTVTKYAYALGERAASGNKYEVHHYNAEGLLLVSEMYHFGVHNSDTPFKYEYKYDSSNRVIEKKDGNFNYTYKYTYTEFDSVATQSKYDSKDGSIKERITNTYDEQHRKVTANFEDALSPSLNTLTQYTYNDNIMTTVTKYVESNELFGTSVYQFDVHGNIIQNNWTNGETGKESLIDKFEYDYNSDGSIKKIVDTIGLYGDITIYEYTYNNNGTINTIHVTITSSVSPVEYELVYTYAR